MRRIRIGIDVGGTFTDAVAIDGDSYEIIAQAKIPTTHDDSDGVAKGIIKILQLVLENANADPSEVTFIAHGTTQATNALLEGDTATVGIVALGDGIISGRVAEDTKIGDIELAPGKYLHTCHRFIKTAMASDDKESIKAAFAELKKEGATVIAATEAFSVDDSANEEQTVQLARDEGFYATGGYEVSRLYGLRVRTRTAVVNASLIPKMLETADLTEACVKSSGIGAPLMIMRCDGGVMTVDEVRRRPILTMLSGLAAGVAGALMYEKMSDGIFLEAGGTSTDISVIKNGRVMVRYGEIGGHKMYLNSLDVRTLGVAGGSLIRVENGKITDVGPRSAHIAGLKYEAFSDPMINPQVEYVAPCADDAPVYAVISENGNQLALTLAGAANVIGSIPGGDYAAGNHAGALAAWTAFGKTLGLTAEEAAKQVMDIAAEKIGEIVRSLIKDYELVPSVVTLAGGGGSGGVVVPYLGKKMGLDWKLVKNAPIISTIGVALAMVREVVERTVNSPTEEDIRLIRREAKERVLKSGAAEEAVEIAIEIDQKANILRAIAMGTTELRAKDMVSRELSEAERSVLAAKAIGTDKVKSIARCGRWEVYEGWQEKTRLGVLKTRQFLACIMDRDGVIRLKTVVSGVLCTTISNLETELTEFIDKNTEYGTIGGQLPKLYVFFGERQLDLSGLITVEQVSAVLDMEFEGFLEKETVIIVAGK